jgi:hypothetical protein
MALLLSGIWIGGMLRSSESAADTGSRFMPIVRLYTGSDNRSHFEELKVPLADRGKVGFLSDPVQVKNIVFRETAGDYNYDFHPAPRRQYVVNLEGAVEIEIGDGTKRVVGAGEILLAEDTTGQGHISRAVAGKPRKSLFITLE